VDLLKSELLARHFPVFRDAEEVIADPVVRNRGTIGGSLCQADAAEDLSAVCSAAKANVVIRGPEGERVVPMSDFHVGPFTTAVGDGELLTEVRLPLRPGGGSAHEKVERRAGDWAIAAASAVVWLDGDTIVDAGLALAAVGPTTIDVTRAEELLLDVARKLKDDAEFGPLVLEEPEMWGVESVSADGVVLRLVVKTQPLQQWAVARELRRRIKERFDGEGVRVAHPQSAVWVAGDTPGPARSTDEDEVLPVDGPAKP
jgi:hypothetical protein